MPICQIAGPVASSAPGNNATAGTAPGVTDSSYVREFEPSLALVAGDDGLDCYRGLIPQGAAQLAPGGWLLVEVGAGQAVAVRELFAAAGYNDIFTSRDLAGIERVVGGRKVS